MRFSSWFPSAFFSFGYVKVTAAALTMEMKYPPLLFQEMSTAAAKKRCHFNDKLNWKAHVPNILVSISVTDSSSIFPIELRRKIFTAAKMKNGWAFFVLVSMWRNSGCLWLSNGMNPTHAHIPPAERKSEKRRHTYIYSCLLRWNGARGA